MDDRANSGYRQTEENDVFSVKITRNQLPTYVNRGIPVALAFHAKQTS